MLTVVSYIMAAAGILTLFMTGWIKQSLPIGTLILLGVALLVGFGRWRWTLIIGEIVTIFIFVMGFIAPGLFDRLTHPAEISGFFGTWIQELGLILALIFGGIANKENLRLKNKS